MPNGGLAIKSCPTCGSRAIKKAIGSVTTTRTGRSRVIDGIEFYECPDCGERVYPARSVRKIDAEVAKIKARRRLRA